MPDIFNFAVVLLAYFLWLYKEVRLKAEAVRLKADTTYEPTPVVVSGTGVVSGFSRTISNVVSGFSRTLAANLTGSLDRLRRRCAAWRRHLFQAGPGSGPGRAARGARRGGAVDGFAGLRSAPSRSPRRRHCLPSTPRSPASSTTRRATGKRSSIGFRSIDPTRRGKASRSRSSTIPARRQQAVLFNRRLPARFARNVEYFLLGRHFGFIPYYFPGFVAIVAWLVSRSRRDDWRTVTFAGFVLACVAASARAAIHVERRRRSARQSICSSAPIRSCCS